MESERDYLQEARAYLSLNGTEREDAYLGISAGVGCALIALVQEQRRTNDLLRSVIGFTGRGHDGGKVHAIRTSQDGDAIDFGDDFVPMDLEGRTTVEVNPFGQDGVCPECGLSEAECYCPPF